MTDDCDDVDNPEEWKRIQASQLEDEEAEYEMVKRLLGRSE